MLAARTRLIRLLLLVVCGFAAITWPTRHSTASAATSGDDDDDDDSAGGGGGGGGGDDDGATAGDDDDDQVDADQPAVTAGGLYTKKTFPMSAVERPLTVIEGMTEIRLGGNTDLSQGNTFGAFGTDIAARYGYKDNFELLGTFNVDNNNFTSAGVGFEGGLNYDPFAIDFRSELIVTSVSSLDSMGNTTSTTHFGLSVGFPIRYMVKPQIAITALESLFTINFNAKPDLSPSLGVIAAPVPQVAVLANAQIYDTGFEAHKASLLIPVTAAVQLTPANVVDIGLLFRLLSIINAPAGGSVLDKRELELYAQFRF